MKSRAGAVIAATVGCLLATAAPAAVYRVAEHSLVEVGAVDNTTPAPITVASRAVGAGQGASRALPEPGVFLEQAGKLTAAPARRSTTIANLRDTYGPLIAAAAEVYQVDENLLRAVIWRESHFDRRAISPTGARGLMQLMPATARGLHVVDVDDPIANVAGGAHYLRDLLRHYGGDPDLALAAYNAGEGAVRRYGGIPPYRETIGYLAAIRSRLTQVAASRGLLPAP